MDLGTNWALISQYRHYLPISSQIQSCWGIYAIFLFLLGRHVLVKTLISILERLTLSDNRSIFCFTSVGLDRWMIRSYRTSEWIRHVINVDMQRRILYFLYFEVVKKYMPRISVRGPATPTPQLCLSYNQFYLSYIYLYE